MCARVLVVSACVYECDSVCVCGVGCVCVVHSVCARVHSACNDGCTGGISLFIVPVAQWTSHGSKRATGRAICTAGGV